MFMSTDIIFVTREDLNYAMAVSFIKSIKPCKKCGKIPDFYKRITGQFTDRLLPGCPEIHSNYKYSCCCQGCGNEIGEYESLEDALEQWNYKNEVNDPRRVYKFVVEIKGDSYITDYYLKLKESYKICEERCDKYYIAYYKGITHYIRNSKMVNNTYIELNCIKRDDDYDYKLSEIKYCYAVAESHDKAVHLLRKRLDKNIKKHKMNTNALMTPVKFQTPDKRKIEILNTEEAYTYLKDPCKNCTIAHECSGRDAMFCRHMQEMIVDIYGYDEKNYRLGQSLPYRKEISKIDLWEKYFSLSSHRKKHCKGVSDFMFYYAKVHDWKKEYWDEMNMLATVHDIGYYNNPSGKHHGRKGAELLEEAGFSKEFCDLVRYHGKFIDNPSKKQELMWLGDLCMDGNGEYVGYRKRYESICKRYKDDPERLEQVAKIIKHLERYYPEYQ